MLKAYVCNRLPYLKVNCGGGRVVAFENGSYETEDEREQQMIERAMASNPIVFRDLQEEEPDDLQDPEFSEVEPDKEPSLDDVQAGLQRFQEMEELRQLREFKAQVEAEKVAKKDAPDPEDPEPAEKVRFGGVGTDKLEGQRK